MINTSIFSTLLKVNNPSKPIATYRPKAKIMLRLMMGEIFFGFFIDTYEDGTRQFTAKPKLSKPKHLPIANVLSP